MAIGVIQGKGKFRLLLVFLVHRITGRRVGRLLRIFFVIAIENGIFLTRGGNERRHAALERARERAAFLFGDSTREHQHQRAVFFPVAVDGTDELFAQGIQSA